MTEHLQWDSSLSFILAMIGAAVGLGNIWRFSYVLYSNGGGSFFIPYFFAIAILGIPFLILPEQILFKAIEPVEIQYPGCPYLDSEIAFDPVFSLYLFKKDLKFAPAIIYITFLNIIFLY